ncbi:MAG: LysM peptidoglycan-binding domain-containing protein, partial [Acidiferrobacterales bacterium]|nr:LysM peptidoglycan-binding domain-containing protein [Acidiferrobacterales bacterium]
ENLKENYQLVGLNDYKVKPGDSLWNMSRDLGFPLWLIYRLNPELRLSGLSTGKVIKLPQLRQI